MNQQKISDYYNYTIPFYKVFWHKNTHAIHYGFWDVDTKSHTEALINTTETLAKLVEPNAGSVILDAGCGVGGSSIWLAKHVGSHVIGITLSAKQKEKAEKYARQAGVEDKTEFYVQDYLHTDFPDGTFDIVWGLESICYAPDKKDFIREAYRLLKPGGKLIVADGFLRQHPQNDSETKNYQEFLKGFVLNNLAITEEFANDMREVGFQKLQMIDKTREIKKTSEHMYQLSIHWMWLNKTLRFFRLIPQLMVDNMQTGIVQKKFFESVGTYAVFYGEK